MRLLGMEYLRKHDVSDVLDQIAGSEALPGYFREAVPLVQEMVRRFAMVRGNCDVRRRGDFDAAL